jgi:hypothetical protein
VIAVNATMRSDGDDSIPPNTEAAVRAYAAAVIGASAANESVCVSYAHGKTKSRRYCKHSVFGRFFRASKLLVKVEQASGTLSAVLSRFRDACV